MSALVGAWVPALSSYGLRVGGSVLTLSVTPGRPLWVTGDGLADTAAGDGDLLALLAPLVGTLRLTDGRVSGDGSVVVEWSHSATTLPAWVLGFAEVDAALDAAGPCPLIWRPGAALSDDTGDRPRLLSGRREAMSGRVATCSFGQSAARREVGWRLLRSAVVPAFEALDLRALSVGWPVRLYADARALSLGAGFATYALREAPSVERSSRSPTRWDISLDLAAAGTRVELPADLGPDTSPETTAMQVILTSSFTSTAWLEATPVTPPAGAVSHSFHVEAPVAGTLEIQAWDEAASTWAAAYLVETTAAGSTAVVSDVPGRQRARWRPASGTGSVRVLWGSLGRRG